MKNLITSTQKMTYVYLLILIIVVLIILLIVYSITSYFIEQAAWICLGVFVVLIADYIEDKYLKPVFKKYKDYSSGSKGESKVSRCLEELKKDGYEIINDVHLYKKKRKKPNIDHIVIGKNGVFVLETKNYSGKIQFDGRNWSQIIDYGENYKVNKLKKYPDKQVKSNVVSLKKKHPEYSKYGYINAIIVFSHRYVDIDEVFNEINQNPHRNFNVVKLNDLIGYIKHKKITRELSKEEIQQLKSVLMLDR